MIVYENNTNLVDKEVYRITHKYLVLDTNREANDFL